MEEHLLVSLRVVRKKFVMEDYIGSDSIFALVKSGSFYMESENGCFTVRKNEGAVFQKNILYHRKVISPVTLYLFRYRSDAPLFGTEHVIFRDQKRLGSTFEMLEALDAGIFKEDFEYRRHLFRDLVVQYSLENGITPSADPCIAGAIARIKSDLHRGVNLSMIGKDTGLSYVQFLRRFKAFTGISPSDYVTALRLQKAKEMLISTDLRIRDISVACGFENEYYFSNFFKKHTGMSPSAFRDSFS